MVKMTDLNVIDRPNWCPGCGNFGILIALKGAILDLNIEPENIAMISGIGCSGKLPHWIRTYGLHGIHGRSLPVATAVKLANNGLTVFIVGGDGDGYGIGMCHFIHTMRRNIDMTYIVHNNMIYGLTTGQTSPTSQKGVRTKSTPSGAIEVPVNPIALAISSGATFVARSFTGDVKHLQKTIVAAVKHRGLSFIDVFQPCVSFNYINTYDWYRQRVYDLQDAGHDTTDKIKAFTKSQEWGEHIPIGIFYEVLSPTYEDELPQIKDTPLVKQPIDKIDISGLMDDFV
ncbi:2-oxoglutarate/2-oxoacid ferredoxin oxidoreductase subunit beta [Methanosarcinales archaeon]|nr:2-oxoglutarate/2-oxoacid ferredoxin oxidoreductase subunit beta [Methanosarcinales archaeon]